MTKKPTVTNNYRSCILLLLLWNWGNCYIVYHSWMLQEHTSIIMKYSIKLWPNVPSMQPLKATYMQPKPDTSTIILRVPTHTPSVVKIIISSSRVHTHWGRKGLINNTSQIWLSKNHSVCVGRRWYGGFMVGILDTITHHRRTHCYDNNITVPDKHKRPGQHRIDFQKNKRPAILGQHCLSKRPTILFRQIGKLFHEIHN